MQAKKDDTFRDFALDQLALVDGVACRSMFGGYGLYCRGVFFGILSKNRLYFKTDAATASKYAARGMKPFQPSATQRLKNYYEVPGDIIEDAPVLCEWARDALAIAGVRRSTR